MTLKSKTTFVQNWLWNLKQLLLHCLDDIARLFITFAQADFLPCMLQFLIRIFIYLWCFHWVKSILRFVSFSPSALKTFWIYFHPNTTTARELPHSPYVDCKTNMRQLWQQILKVPCTELLRVTNLKLQSTNQDYNSSVTIFDKNNALKQDFHF